MKQIGMDYIHVPEITSQVILIGTTIFGPIQIKGQEAVLPRQNCTVQFGPALHGEIHHRRLGFRVLVME